MGRKEANNFLEQVRQYGLQRGTVGSYDEVAENSFASNNLNDTFDDGLEWGEGSGTKDAVKAITAIVFEYHDDNLDNFPSDLLKTALASLLLVEPSQEEISDITDAPYEFGNHSDLFEKGTEYGAIFGFNLTINHTLSLL